jgi:hypothetical protein
VRLRLCGFNFCGSIIDGNQLREALHDASSCQRLVAQPQAPVTLHAPPNPLTI